jgi:hypothetical protein
MRRGSGVGVDPGGAVGRGVGDDARGRVGVAVGEGVGVLVGVGCSDSEPLGKRKVAVGSGVGVTDGVSVAGRDDSGGGSGSIRAKTTMPATTMSTMTSSVSSIFVLYLSINLPLIVFENLGSELGR